MNLQRLTAMKHRSTLKKARIFTLAALTWLLADPAPVLAAIGPDKDGIVYIKEGATGSGRSWTDAAGELADALKAAKTDTDIRQIWVAQGTYHPLYSPADNNFGNPATRDNAFLMVNGVSVYGGFKGDETALSQRNLDNPQFASILDGETKGSKSYHVVIAVGATSNLTKMDGFTIKNGNANGVGELTIGGQLIYRYSGGGAYLSHNSVVTFQNVTVTENYSSQVGGGVASISNDVAIIRNTRIYGNTVSRLGGGIYHIGTHNKRMTLIDSYISGNSAVSTTHQRGGGIYSTTHLTLRNVVISGNKSEEGSALYSFDDTQPGKNNITIVNTTISGNHAYDGSQPRPVIYHNGTIPLNIDNSVVWGNSGGINIAGTGNAIYRNSLVQGTTTNDGAGNKDGSLYPQFLDAPHFSTAPFSGGSYAILPVSPLANAGNAAHFTASGGNPAIDKDIAGKARVFQYGSGGIIDIGAFEYHTVTPAPHANGILYVKKFSAGNGSSWANALGEVADALKAAKTNSAIKQIWVAGGIYKPFYNPDDTYFGNLTAGRNAAFVLIPGVEVYGGFAGTESSVNQRNLSNTANQSTLSGDLLGNDDSLDDNPQGENAYHVVIRAGFSASRTLLDGFTVSSGISDGLETYPAAYVNGVDVRPNAGGGIIIRSTSSSPIAFANLKIHFNYAEKGGGIHIYNSSLLLEQTEISYNHASQGGGVFKSGALGESEFTQVRIYHCGAASAGGGIYASGPLKLRFSNGQIDQNQAFSGAGVVSVNRMEFTIRKSLFQSNMASGGGGAILNSDRAVLDAKYVTFSGNRVTVSTGNGAGMINGENATARLMNVLFIGNQSYRGSAVWGDDASTTVFVNVTVSGNRSTAPEAGAVMARDGSVLKVHNSIIWKNSGGVSPTGSNTIEYKHSLVQGATTDDAEGNISSSTNPGFTDAPEFSTAPFTGGDYRLLSSTTLLDKGSNALYTDAGGDPENDPDLAGNQRVFDYANGGIIEMGAYERSLPDLRPSVNMPSRSFTASSLSKALSVTIFNETPAATGLGTVTVNVTRPNDYFTLTLGEVEGWSLETFPAYWKLTYNGAFPLPQTIPLTLSLPGNDTKGGFTFTPVIPNGTAGDTNNSNNKTDILLTVN